MSASNSVTITKYLRLNAKVWHNFVPIFVFQFQSFGRIFKALLVGNFDHFPRVTFILLSDEIQYVVLAILFAVLNERIRYQLKRNKTIRFIWFPLS